MNDPWDIDRLTTCADWDRYVSTLIRPANFSDIQCLILLARSTITHCYTPFLGREAVTGRGAVDEYIRNNLGRSLVILANHCVVGFSSSQNNRIDLIMVSHELQRRGIGSELLRHLEGELFCSHAELQLESFEGNEPANRFLKKNGWLAINKYFDEEAATDKLVFSKTR